MDQSIASVSLAGGNSVAYATTGSGQLLLLVGGWLSHLDLSWAFATERFFLEALAVGRTLVRYDRLGCGLSDRPRPTKWSLELERETIGSIMSEFAGRSFDVMGSSLGVPVAVDWAATHPETVNRLVLYGGWAQGAAIATPQVREHVLGLVRSHWGLGSDVLTEIFAPEASTATRAALSDYQRQASSAETAADLLAACYEIDVTERLGEVAAPTLVLHRKHDPAAPLEQSQQIASGIPGARLVELPGRSHLPFVGDTGALVAEIRRFLGLPALRRAVAPRLTARQREVAELVSQGLTNHDIGRRLGIDERSAEGHVERIRNRLGFHSRTQIAAWWVSSEIQN